MNGRIPRRGLVAGLSNPSGQFSSRLVAFLRPHLDDSLRCRVNDGLAAAGGLGLQAKPKLITFQPYVQLASADTQLLTNHLMAHTTMKRSLPQKDKFCSFLGFVLNENCLVTPAVTRTVLRSRCHCSRSNRPGKREQET